MWATDSDCGSNMVTTMMIVMMLVMMIIMTMADDVDDRVEHVLCVGSNTVTMMMMMMMVIMVVAMMWTMLMTGYNMFCMWVVGDQTWSIYSPTRALNTVHDQCTLSNTTSI